MAKQSQGQTTRTPNDDRSDALNPNNSQRQAAVDEHSRRSNPEDSSNAPDETRKSNMPGEGES